MSEPLGRLIFVTSFKGGVGKTTITAGLAGALTSRGMNVLVIDGDFGMRCMDLVLGIESGTVFDLFDIITERCSINGAISPSVNPLLYFIAAPTAPDEAQLNNSVRQFDFSAFFNALKKKFDFIIIDSGTNKDALYEAFARSADEAIVVSAHQATSIRAAEHTATILHAYGIEKVRLIINGFKADQAQKGLLPGIVEIINRSGSRLVGIVPFDKQVSPDQESGRIACSGKKRGIYEKSLLNIADRLLEKNVPLFFGIYHNKAKKKLL